MTYRVQPSRRRGPSVAGVLAYKVRLSAGDDHACDWVVMAANAGQAITTAVELNPGLRVISCRLAGEW